MADYNEDLLSRQVGAYGKDTQLKLVQMRVLVIGMRGLGMEVAKNLILGNPKQVHVWDDTPVELRDLSANFFVQERNIGKMTRAEACHPQLAELNPYVNVEVVEGYITKNVLMNYDIVVMTELYYGLSQAIEINNILRKNPNPKSGIIGFRKDHPFPNRGFILALNLGAYAGVFVDFGSKFICHDMDGEKESRGIVTIIEDGGIVTTHDKNRHGLSDGEYCIFEEVKGLDGINSDQKPNPFKVHVINQESFQILDYDDRVTGQYEEGGIVKSFKMPQELEFDCLEDSIVDPLDKAKDGALLVSDYSLFERPTELHNAL